MSAEDVVRPKELRSELSYQSLDPAQQPDADRALIEAVKVHFAHEAVQGIPNEEFVLRERCINSRALLVNKGEKESHWECKGRWFCGGQHDPDLAKIKTTSPTAMVLAYAILLTLCIREAGRHGLPMCPPSSCRARHCRERSLCTCAFREICSWLCFPGSLHSWDANAGTTS